MTTVAVEKEKMVHGKKTKLNIIDDLSLKIRSSASTLYADWNISVEYKRGTIRFLDSNGVIVNQLKLYSNLRSMLARGQLFNRLLRLEPRSVLRISDTEFMFSFSGAMHRYDLNTHSMSEEFRYAAGTNNPLAFCVYERNGTKEVVFGDYGGHDEKGNVGIYLRRDGKYREISSFPGDKIDHIHRVEYDIYRDIYWIFTGDFDAGCGIWTMDCDTGEIKPFLVGKQQYRGCVAFIGQDSIIYATDSPFEQNYIYELSLQSKKLKVLYEMPGPCIYGVDAAFEDEKLICLSTSVEGDPSLSKWKYRFSNKLGDGVKDRYSHVIAGNVQQGFREVYKNEKDRWNMYFFQFGNHKFPTQYLENEIIFVPQSCKNNNGQTISLRGI